MLTQFTKATVVTINSPWDFAPMPALEFQLEVVTFGEERAISYIRFTGLHKD